MIPTQQLGEFFDGAFGPSSSTLLCAENPTSNEASDASIGAECHTRSMVTVNLSAAKVNLAEIPWSETVAPSDLFVKVWGGGFFKLKSKNVTHEYKLY